MAMKPARCCVVRIRPTRYYLRRNTMRNRNLKLSVLCVFLVASATSFAERKWDQGLLVEVNGKTLYTFDKDSAGKSNCKGACLNAWPIADAGANETPFGNF